MKITARDLMELGLIERVISEGEPACADNIDRIAEEMDKAMEKFLAVYLPMTREELADQRYERFRRM